MPVAAGVGAGVGAASSTADNIAQRRSTLQRRAFNSNRLDALATAFDSFYGELEQDVTAEHVAQEDRLVGLERCFPRPCIPNRLHDSCSRLQTHAEASAFSGY